MRIGISLSLSLSLLKITSHLESLPSNCILLRILVFYSNPRQRIQTKHSPLSTLLNKEENQVLIRGSLDTGLIIYQAKLDLLDTGLIIYQAKLGLLDTGLIIYQAKLGSLDTGLIIYHAKLGLLDTGLIIYQAKLGLLDTGLTT